MSVPTSPPYPQPATAFRPPTAWQSLPQPVRFAVWIWTVFVIAGVVGATVGAVLWVVFLFAALGQM